MKRILAIVVLALLLTACAPIDWLTNMTKKNEMPARLPTRQIVLKTASQDVPLTVEVADEELEREQGLMQREKLNPGEGMWFVFQDESPRRFWMRNTLIPLDIIFFNSKLQVVQVIENMEPCKTDQCQYYPSGSPAMYALEVPAGFVRQYGVGVGDEVEMK